jgi:phospho-N-acetylmuramoyl-pentapeptide-transferase
LEELLLAIAVRKELLIPLLCVFLVENLSVVIQVSYFKYTKNALAKAEESS